MDPDEFSTFMTHYGNASVRRRAPLDANWKMGHDPSLRSLAQEQWQPTYHLDDEASSGALNCLSKKVMTAIDTRCDWAGRAMPISQNGRCPPMSSDGWKRLTPGAWGWPASKILDW